MRTGVCRVSSKLHRYGHVNTDHRFWRFCPQIHNVQIIRKLLYNVARGHRIRIRFYGRYADKPVC